MNKIFRWFILSFFIVGLSACSDWLDYTPKDKQTYDQQFSTMEGFHSALNGIYNKLKANSLYGYNLSYGPIDVMASLYNIPTSNILLTDYYRGVWTGTYPTSGFSDIWKSAYNVLLNINLLLEAIEDKGDDVLKDNDKILMKGELLALRAMVHFDLVRLFGPLPSMPEELAVPYAESTEVIKRDRLSLDEIIHNYILRDLEEAQSLLVATDPVIENGAMTSDGGDEGNWERYRQLRLNYFAVSLLKARAHLWMGEKQPALSEARKITDDPNAEAAFPWIDPTSLIGNGTNPDRIFSSECIFGFYNRDLSNIFELNFSGILDNSSSLHSRNGYVDILYENSADFRRQSQWAASASSTSDYDFIKFKGFSLNDDNPEFWGTFFALMRKSEAFLIASEALLDSDPMASLNYINKLRAARNEEQLEDNSSEHLSHEIKMEYIRELRGEGQIYFLFKRNNQVFGTSSGGNENTKMYDGGGASQSNDVPNASVRYNVPIPSDETY